MQELLAQARRLRRAVALGGGDGDGDGTALAERLDASVLRPLAALVADEDEDEAGDEAEEAGPTSVDEQLWQLARAATEACAPADAPSLLVEAAAALQDLAAPSPEQLAELRALLGDRPPGIRVSTDGPYLATGPTHLRDHLGCELEASPLLALCRCGRSSSKPRCDGSHAEAGFSGAKDPGRVPDRRDSYVGLQVTVLDNRGICQHSGLCTDRLGTVFRAGEERFVAPSGGRMDEIVRAVRDCPSGALGFAVDGVEARADADHHGTRAPEVLVSRDGPYRVTGGVELTEDPGVEPERAEGASREHYALCRCGQSRNKPFCSGMHHYVGFADPVPAEGHVPTIFEWAGGLPALTRMTRFFYETHVPEDPLLAPLFGEMEADHPERVARWLGEVFGGPKAYSETYGGYPHMLSQHRGRCLTEEQRQRWVALLTRSAMEAGLPNDAEFRAAFGAYLEWGSRLAVENSQVRSRPPEHMPMPRWDWSTGAGPPGSRTSALAPAGDAATDVEVAEVALPGPDEPLSFEAHIRPLFRTSDRRSMSFAFDLWSADDVRTHAGGILARLRSGTMPCDGPWPADRVAVFERWVAAGSPG